MGRRVLIAGCGYVGGALAKRLIAQGDAVWGLKRDPSTLPAGVNPFAADLADRSTLDTLPPDLDDVVYAAAAGGFEEARYRAAYRDGPRNLLDALVSQGQSPRRIVFTSSTSVYSQSDGAWVDEDSVAEPTHFAGSGVRAGEDIFAEGPFDAVSIRFGGIYGPGRTRLIERVRSGAARRTRGEPRYTNRIHRDDCAGAVAHLLGLESTEAIYNGVDRDPAPLNDVLSWLAKTLDCAEPPFDDASGPSSPLRSNKRVRGNRLVGSGYAFVYPSFRQGYDALIRSKS